MVFTKVISVIPNSVMRHWGAIPGVVTLKPSIQHVRRCPLIDTLSLVLNGAMAE
jgi:hypothetical protein